MLECKHVCRNVWRADRSRVCVYNKVMLLTTTISQQEDALKATKNEAGDEKLKILKAPVPNKFTDYLRVMKT